MSIDAIGPIVTAIDSLKHELPDERRRREAAAQLAAEEPTPQEAIVVTASDEVIAERLAADALALRDAAGAAKALGASDADRHEAVGHAARADGAAVQEAVDALLEAGRENLAVNAEILTAERDGAAVSGASDREATASDAQEQETVDIGTSNAGVQNAYGALPSPTTGVPPLRQPGVSIFA